MRRSSSVAARHARTGVVPVLLSESILRIGCGDAALLRAAGCDVRRPAGALHSWHDVEIELRTAPSHVLKRSAAKQQPGHALLRERESSA